MKQIRIFQCDLGWLLIWWTTTARCSGCMHSRRHWY